LHYSYRFDPHGLNQSERERLRLGAKTFLANLAGTRPTAATPL